MPTPTPGPAPARVVIAIDGPSGSGKSTVARALARSLSGGYLDTGAMYRALTWWCLERGLDLADHEAVADAAVDVPLLMSLDPDDARVRVGEVDVTDAIRGPAVTGAVSAVATNLGVRPVLQQAQRELIARGAEQFGAIVAEGRDITTVVAPDADVRVLLTADESERVRRRAAQDHGEGANPEALEQARLAVGPRDAADSAVSQFTVAADGVVTLDTTGLDVQGAVLAVLDLVRRAGDEQQDTVRVMRAGLADYELDEADLSLLDGGAGGGDTDAGEEGPAPVVAVVGRPNVGKSTFVNRVLGRREAVVEDVPGVTRDRVAYEGSWSGRRFTLVDTGGWDVDVSGMRLRIAEQAEIAVELADVVVFVVDATVGATDADEAVVKMLRRSGKPVVLVANKVDDQRGEADATALWSLGLGQPWPVSALHGRGSGDALDAVIEVLPEVSAVGGAYQRGGPRRVALLGRPNVGKSSLLNRLVGHDRVVVDDVAGTTRDPVDEFVELGGRTWRFVDTAGIRRRIQQARGADFYAALRTQAALEKAEVAVVLLDAGQPLAEQDVRVISQVVETGRALVLAYNKWDTVDEERRYVLEREIEKDLAHVAWAPRVNISARTGRHLERLVPAVDRALDGWETRISTSRLNGFLAEVVARQPHPVRGGRQPRILFATQASSRPPRFVLFTSGFLEAGYRRFLERMLRERFGFAGTPVEISVRVRERRRGRR